MNELCHEAVFRSLSDEKKRQVQGSKVAMFGVNLGSGIIAGFAAAILSQVNSFINLHRSRCLLILFISLRILFSVRFVFLSHSLMEQGLKGAFPDK